MSTLSPSLSLFSPRNTRSRDPGKTLAEQLSYLHSPRPFKNPNYTKNVNRRAKNLKNVLAQERERERTERERKRVEREMMKMDVDVDVDGGMKQDLDEEEDIPTCSLLDDIDIHYLGLTCVLYRYIHRSPSVCLAAEALL